MRKILVFLPFLSLISCNSPTTKNIIMSLTDITVETYIDDQGDLIPHELLLSIMMENHTKDTIYFGAYRQLNDSISHGYFELILETDTIGLYSHWGVHKVLPSETVEIVNFTMEPTFMDKFRINIHKKEDRKKIEKSLQNISIRYVPIPRDYPIKANNVNEIHEVYIKDYNLYYIIPDSTPLIITMSK